MISQNDKNKSEDHATQNHSDFSIDHILNRAGTSSSNSDLSFNICDNSARNPRLSLDPYSWLQCTRYCPPKVPRTQKKDGPQKRQLGRHPRIPFTSHQLSVLEEKFQQSPYLSSEEVIMLSGQLQLADVRVKIWFQNRRARERREKLAQTSDSESQESHDKEPISLNPREETSSTPVVQNTTETHLFNYVPPHPFLQNHLGAYLMPVTNYFANQSQYPSNNDTS